VQADYLKTVQYPVGVGFQLRRLAVLQDYNWCMEDGVYKIIA
jgi:hypothetical protein